MKKRKQGKEREIQLQQCSLFRATKSKQRLIDDVPEVKVIVRDLKFLIKGIEVVLRQLQNSSGSLKIGILQELKRPHSIDAFSTRLTSSRDSISCAWKALKILC